MLGPEAQTDRGLIELHVWTPREVIGHGRDCGVLLGDAGP
jgi:hypothetical protein